MNQYVQMQMKQLIAQQELEIETLKAQVAAHQDAINRVHGIIFCIGGPLNDNKLRYTDRQLNDFWMIKEALVL